MKEITRIIIIQLIKTNEDILLKKLWDHIYNKSQEKRIVRNQNFTEDVRYLNNSEEKVEKEVMKASQQLKEIN